MTTDLRFDTISFLSDYGHGDEFVGVVHSVIRSLVRGVDVIDICHEVEPFNVRDGALTLARASLHLVPGVVLAVVDPGVGAGRKGVAIEVGDGQSFLVGPDNGVLAPAVAMVGGATGAVVLDNPEYQLPGPSNTFDGRDVFAPAAAHLCRGVPMEELGTVVDPVQLVPGVMPVSEPEDDGTLSAEVLWIDRFGNVQLNVEPEQLAGWPETIEIRGGRESRVAQTVTTFAGISTMSLGLLVDSYGLIAVAGNRESAADALGVAEADPVVLAPLAGRPPARTTSTESPVVFTTNPGPEGGAAR
ncbi:MAG: SAM-dependent chlorinase/fluorinase [Actinomycetota bacterium]